MRKTVHDKTVFPFNPDALACASLGKYPSQSVVKVDARFIRVVGRAERIRGGDRSSSGICELNLLLHELLNRQDRLGRLSRGKYLAAYHAT